jgi:hypothetical protein
MKGTTRGVGQDRVGAPPPPALALIFFADLARRKQKSPAETDGAERVMKARGVSPASPIFKPTPHGPSSRYPT